MSRMQNLHSKWPEDLHVSPKTEKLLQENRRGKLHDIRFGNDFFDMMPKAQVAK